VAVVSDGKAQIRKVTEHAIWHGGGSQRRGQRRRPGDPNPRQPARRQQVQLSRDGCRRSVVAAWQPQFTPSHTASKGHALRSRPRSTAGRLRGRLDFSGPAPRRQSITCAAEASPAANPSVALGAKVTADWWTLFRAPEINTLVNDAIAGSRPWTAPRLGWPRRVRRSPKLRRALSTDEFQCQRHARTEQRLQSRFEVIAISGAAEFNLFQLGPTASYDLDLFGARAVRSRSDKSEASFQQLTRWPPT